MKLAHTSIYPTIVLLVLFSLVQPVFGQQRGVNDTIKTYAYITPEGDTLSLSYLPTVQVAARMSAKWKKHWQEWTRLRNAVYVTYPYAKAASKIMNEINAKLVNVSDSRARKAIIHAREADLRKEFTSRLSNLSVYQGKVLMKLINRETGNNCYEIIQEYKGSFTAAFTNRFCSFLAQV
jgi:hypothetical protein